MAALTLFIIRHAEKPDPAGGAPGLTIDGTADPRSLLIQGWQRAGAWAALFGAALSPDYPRPDAIYAANPDRIVGPADLPSRRPWQTIVPLAARSGLDPLIRWAQGEEAQLAAELAARTGTALVCWEHKRIADILMALGNGQPIPGAPRKWKRERFDVVYRLQRSAPAAPWQFQQMFPRLIAGDTDAPM